MTTLGVIVANRGFFPGVLCESGRETMLRVLKEQGFSVIALGPHDTPYGAVETYEQAKRCADLFRAHRDEIDGILVTLPNFGDERAVADTIRLADLGVPVLVHAFPDEATHMDISARRDSFCGKMSVCNNLRQYGIRYSITRLHTVDPETPSFRADLDRFAAVCRVARGLRRARFGLVGARPANFITVRFSEKILEQAGISVETVDLSEILGRANRLSDDDAAVRGMVDRIRSYISAAHVAPAALGKMARFALVLEDWIAAHELVGTAIQCWTAIEEYYGVVPCAVMSMMSNRLLPSACETDITGLIGMHAMVLASGRPSALLDWNNNYGDDPDKGVVFHCSNLPQDIFGGCATMDYQAIIAGTVGRQNAYGTVVGQIRPTPVTYCRVSTDDAAGRVRAYLGEAEITADALSTFGGYGVIRVPAFQTLLAHICEHGYEHHVAVNPAQVADAVHEAMTKYLGWNVYFHRG